MELIYDLNEDYIFKYKGKNLWHQMTKRKKEKARVL